MIKGFLFDLDGVITDTARFHFEAWKELADELRIPIDLSFNEHLKGVDRMTSLQRILEHGKRENDFTKEEKETFAEEKNKRYQALISEMTKKDLLPGILPFLEELKENHYSLGVASASQNAPKILSYLEIEGFFDVVVDPKKVAKGKPAPDIFLLGQKLLDLKADEVIGIEDAYSGIEAIKKAQMFAIGIGDQEVLKNADVVFSDTTALSLNHLKELNIL